MDLHGFVNNVGLVSSIIDALSRGHLLPVTVRRHARGLELISQAMMHWI